MDIIIFIALLGVFGGFIWNHFGQGIHTAADVVGATPSEPASTVVKGHRQRKSLPCDEDPNGYTRIDDEEFHRSPDYITDPTYFWMPGNIFYQESPTFDDTTSDGCCETDWMTDPACACMEGNIFHDDLCSSSFSNDDSWNSSSFSDDSWSSSSFND
ncbi:hypothetical protein [Geobacter anodireducens]